MAWSEDQPMVSIKDLHKSFGALEVLKGISMDVMKGEVVCIIGPSGSGKSTLIRCVNALNDIQQGSILVEGQEVNDHNLDKLELRKKVGMVFQQYNLFPHKTALENIMMAPLLVLKQDKAEVEKLARQLIKKVRLEGKEESYPGELSGGQQQRVAIARTLLKNPNILIFDEATSALDSHSEKAINKELQTISKNKTTLVIAHRLSTIVDADIILVLDHGRIIERGTHNKLLSQNGHYSAMWALQQSEGSLHV